MVRTRIAPSPTGQDLHIGNLYTALINWTFARKHKGKFIIRIEDTDRFRYVKGAEEKILKTLKNYGLDYDEAPDKKGPFSPYRQSERLESYQKYAQDLVAKGYAYYCVCTPERLSRLRKEQQGKKMPPRYDKKCRNSKLEIRNSKQYVIRLKVPREGETSFSDVVRGKISFQNKLIDDQVLLKSDGFPTYHLAVVVDDHLMGISHVIRAEEWISSTPKHILLYKAFGWDLPVFAHVPVLRNPNRSKLSKRKNPVWAGWYLEQGFLPEAVLNYLALMGWSHPEEKDIFSLDEFIKVFDLKDLKPVGPAFDPAKLEWMSGEYIRKFKIENLKLKIYKFYNKKYSEDLIGKSTPLVRERIKKLSDYLPLCEFFFERPKKYEMDLSGDQQLIAKMQSRLKQIKDWKADIIGAEMQALAKEEGIKNSRFFMILRVAVSGKKITPPLNESMEILGKEECLERIKNIQTKKLT